MAALYQDYPLGEGGYTYQDFRQRLEEAADAELAQRLEGWVYRAEPLPLAETLETMGWKFGRNVIDKTPVQVSLRITLRGDPPIVRVARLGGPGWRASVNTRDELLAQDNARIGGGLNALLRRYEPGDTAALTLFRDGVLRTLSLTLDPVLPTHELLVDEDESPNATRLRSDWLSGVAEEKPENQASF